MPTADDDVVIPAPASGTITVYLRNCTIAAHNLTIGEGDGAGSVVVESEVKTLHTVSGSLVVTAKGALNHRAAPNATFNLSVAGDMTIAKGGLADVSGRGYAYGSQDSRGTDVNSAHSSHGARFDDTTPNCYGSIRQPVDYGSYGPHYYGGGGPGGGVVHFIVGGTLKVDGDILSEGRKGTAIYQGTGGSIWIEAGTLAGGGTISVNPGDDLSGGGRLAIYQRTATDLTAFTGQILAKRATYYLENANDAGRGTLTLGGDWKYDVFAENGGAYKRIVYQGSEDLVVDDGVVCAVSGDLDTMDGTFQAGADAGLEILAASGSTVRLAGSLSLGSLVCVNPGATIAVDAGTEVQVGAGGLLRLRGTADSAMNLQGEGGTWDLSVGEGAEIDVRYVAAKNCVSVTRTIPDFGGSDGGGNVNWEFPEAPVEGCRIVWTGANGTDWNDPGNWQVESSGQSRAALDTDIIVIPAGTVHPVLAGDVKVYGAEIQSGACIELHGRKLSVSHDLSCLGSFACSGSEVVAVEGNVTLAANALSGEVASLVLAGGAGQTVSCGGNSFAVITVEAPSVVFEGGFTAGRFICDQGRSASLRFSAGDTYVVKASRVIAPESSMVSLDSTVADSAWLLKASAGLMFVNCSVKDCDARPGSTIVTISFDDRGGNENWVADVNVWTGAKNSSWADAGNWTAGVPGKDSYVIIAPAGVSPVISTAGTTVRSLTLGTAEGAGDLTANAELTVIGDFFIGSGCTLTANRPIVVSNDVTVAGGGKITHKDVTGGKVDLTVEGNMLVDVGGKVDVTQCGYRDNYGHNLDAGPGGAARGTPGNTTTIPAYGGHAANSVKPCYGSIRQPTDWGSGGFENKLTFDDAHTCSGGGVIRLTVAGTLTVNGEVRADGYDPKFRSCAGAGGSVWLTASVLRGGGTISCRPGNFNSPGGGRMAIYQTMAMDLSAFSGIFDSQDGTRYIQNAGDEPGRGSLFLDGTLITDLYTNQIATAEGAADGDIPFGRIVCSGTGKISITNDIVVKVYGDVVATNATVEAVEGTKGGLDILGAAEGVTHLSGTYDLHAFVCTNGTAALEFAAGMVVNVADDGIFWLNGDRSPGGRMTLKSSEAEQAWYLNVGTNLTGKVRSLDVSDSDASGGETITSMNSVGKRARNLNWVFPNGFMLMVK